MPLIVDKDKKRREIIEAAIAVFSRAGYRRSRMQEIADEAGVGKGTVYEYFSSKQDLFLQMSEHLYQQYVLSEEEVIRQIDDPTEQIRRLIASTLEKAAMWTGWVHLFADMWSEVDRKGEHDNLRNLMKDMLERMVGITAGYIRKAQGRGIFKDYDADLVAYILMGVLDGLMLQTLINKDMYDMQKMIDTLTGVLMDGLKR